VLPSGVVTDHVNHSSALRWLQQFGVVPLQDFIALSGGGGKAKQLSHKGHRVRVARCVNSAANMA